MPAIPTTPPILHVISYVEMENGTYQFSSYWAPESPDETYEDLLATVNAAHSAIGTVWAAVASASASLTATRGIQYAGSGFLDAFAEVSPIVGGIADEDDDQAMPTESALVIQRLTATRGPKGRGRMFIPGLHEDVNDNGRVNVADYATEVAAIASFFGADKTWDGTDYHARHWNREDNVMAVVTHCRALTNLANRSNRAVKKMQLPVAG